MKKYGSYRGTWAEINLDHFKYNIQTLKNAIGEDILFCAIVKADAYGHGAVQMGKEALESGANYLGVALLDEALELRQNGIDSPILVLGPTFGVEAVEVAVRNDVTLTVFTKRVAEEVVQAAQTLDKQAKVHLVVDTGMGRIGTRTKEEALEVVEALQKGNVKLEGLFTHFADSETDNEYTMEQFSLYQENVDYLKENGVDFDIYHVANGAADLQYPDLRLDMVREGVNIYGLAPDDSLFDILPLKPVMTLKTTVSHVKTIHDGDSVSYGRLYRAEGDRKIASITIGYADGIPRSLTNQTAFTIHGQQVQIAGAVAMDQIMLDVTDINDVQVGDEVIIFGDGSKGDLKAHEIGAKTDMIERNLWTAVGHRVPRIYYKNGQKVETVNHLLDV